MPPPQLVKDPCLQALGIDPERFRSKVKLKAATIVADIETQIETSKTMQKVFRDAQRHLDKAIAILDQETVACGRSPRQWVAVRPGAVGWRMLSVNTSQHGRGRSDPPQSMITICHR